MSRLPIRLISVVAVTTFVSGMAASQPGSVDPTFDPGRGPTGLSAGLGYSALVQPDGKILVTGQFNGVGLDFVPAVVRFNPDGSLDTTFNAAALPAQNTYSFEGLANLLALQPNGKVLVSGKFASSDGTSRYLTRLNSDGTIDNTFNPHFDFGTGAAPGIGRAIVLASGKILVGGSFNRVNGVERPVIARLNPDGSLDETFKPAYAFPNFVVQSSGKIVGPIWMNSAYYPVRLSSDGSVDNTFVSGATSTAYSVPGLLVQPDDKIIWTAIQSGFIPEYGTRTVRLGRDGDDDPTFQPYSAVMQMPVLVQGDGKIVFDAGSRLKADGTPDPNFHPQFFGGLAIQQADGKLITVGSLYDQPYGIRRLFLDGSRDDSFAPGLGLTRVGPASVDRATLLPSGRIAVTGNFNYFGQVPRNRIAVLNNNGSLDSAFDAGTVVSLRSDGTSSLNAIAVQPDGKLLLAMDRLVRLNPDGTVDSSFKYSPSHAGNFIDVKIQPDGKILTNGPDGLVRLDMSGALDPAFHAAQSGVVALLQPDGKIMVVGGNRGLTRLFADGTLDPGFGGIGGIATLNFPYASALQTDGRVLVSRRDPSNFRDVFLRFNSDGTTDPTFAPNVASVSLIAVDQTGIYVGGNIAPQTDFTQQQTKLGVVRLKFDGSRDESFAPIEFNQGGRLTGLLLESNGQFLVTGQFDLVNGVERHGIARIIGGAPRKLANISTRANVGTGQMVEIAGFIINGNSPKKIVVRALGPSLLSYGVTSALANPSLELHDATGRILAQNNDWRETQEAEVLATGIPPASELESAIVQTLSPGSYTAVLQGADGGGGIALAEVYDLDPAADSTLANISTRALVQSRDSAIIGGFVLRGAEPSTVVIRAIGPTLASASVTDSLGDPMLEVYDQSGTLVAANDDWKQTQQTELEAEHVCPADDRESAIVATLAPGSYTTMVRGAHGENGVAVVEVYRLNP